MNIETTTAVALVLAVLSIAGAVTGLVVAFRRRTPSPPPDDAPARGWRIDPSVKAWYGLTAISVLVLIIAVGVLVVEIAEDEPMIDIVSHRPGDVVAYDEFVRGTSEHVPDDCTIWLLVSPHDADVYYPQAEVYVLQPGGDWSTRALVGPSPDASGSYDLLAVMADSGAYDDLTAHISNAFTATTAPPLESLPDGVKIYDRISVVRE